jgi:transcriptional regulator with XRE-family HTH domain
VEEIKALGERVKAARLAAGLSVVQAAKRSGLARDTWKKIEAGESVQDAKRQVALDTLGLTADFEPALSDDDVAARLANLDRQVDALWRRVEQLEQGERDEDGEEGGGSTVTPIRPPSTPPPIPEDVAANDPETPSQGDLVRTEQDAGYDIDQDGLK